MRLGLYEKTSHKKSLKEKHTIATSAASQTSFLRSTIQAET